MKKFFSLCLFFFACASVFATNYYLSSTGNDANSGISTLQPWQTITQLNTVSFLPGDSIFFECGSTFRGEIIITSGGNAAAKIYFGKYGIGNLPVISGAEVVSGWSNYLGNIYVASLTQTPSNLFADDKQMTIARYPNNGFLIQQNSIGGNLGFIDTSLTESTGYWNAATVRIRTTDRTWDVSSVMSYSNDSILFQSPTLNSFTGDHGYYFDNLFSLIDTANEWYYDIGNQNLFLIAPGNVNPALIKTEASVYDDGIVIQNGSGNIMVENIEFEKQRKSGILVELNSSDISIASSVFRLQGETGVRIPNGSTKCAIMGNTFSDINGIGISMGFAHNATITKNILSRIGLIAGYGLFPSNNMTAIDCNQSDSVFLSQNIIDSTGSSGIFAGMAGSIISKNVLRNCLLNINNVGSIYVYGTFTFSSIFENNIVLNSMGNIISEPTATLNAVGLYVDESATENTFENNTIAYATTGILIAKNSTGNFIDHNLVYRCNESQLKFSEGFYEGGTVGNVVTGNVFYSLNEAADVVELTSTFESFNPAYFDSNYYFNPYAYHVVKAELAPGGIEFPTYYTLSQWQNKIGMDQNSHSTFFHRSRFHVIDTLANNLITNSFFTNNFDGWINTRPDTLGMLLDNSTPLDFGCLKLSFLYALPDTQCYILFIGFSLDSGNLYQLHFSNYSIKDGNTVIKTKENANGYGYVAAAQAFPFNDSRNDYNSIIQTFKSCSNCQLAFVLSGLDSIVWLDNITLFPVNATIELPEKKSRLFVNASDAETTFNLGDSIFYNLDQIQVTGSITLPPYSSSILIFDSSMILSVNEEAMNQSMKIFPNPVGRGGTLNLFLPQTNNEVQISISDLQGEKVLSQFLPTHSNSISVEVPPFISQGIYFITVKENDRLWSGKIVVM